MAAQNVVKPNEIMLGGVRFPIKGKVRIANISVTPNPIAFGDASRAGETQVMSQLIQTAATGGSGVFKANPRTDTERFWTSECETRYRNLICLPPLTYNMSKPAGLTSEEVVLTKEYSNFQYFVFAGGKVYRWNDAGATFNDNGTVTGGWSALLVTLTTNPSDACVFLDYLYFAENSSTQKMVLSGGVETLSAVAGTAGYLRVWDEKLWRVSLVGTQWVTQFTTLGGVAGEVWTTGGSFPSGIVPTQLTTFRNVAGDEVLAALTNVGLWLYDATSQKWRQTEVRIPAMPFGQRSVGDFFRDGKLYFTAGNMGLVGVQPGNPFIVTPVGLDRDDGLPAVESGQMIAVTSDFNWLLAMVDGTVVTSTDTMYSGLGAPFDTPEWSVSAGVLTLRAFNGAWSTIWKSGATATATRALNVSGAYSKRRVYWGASGVAYCQDLSGNIFNPRFNPSSKFAPGPLEHTTSWYDFGSDVQHKIQGHFWMRTSGCSATETVQIYYQSDPDVDVWVLLDTITTNGLHELKPGGAAGVQCQLIRFKFVLQRGTTATNTPRIEFWTADFMRILPATYAFVVMLDLTKSHQNRTPSFMAQQLKDFADANVTRNMIQFTYQDTFDAEPQTHWGRVSRLQGQGESGTSLRGQGWFQLSFTVPYLGDSE